MNEHYEDGGSPDGLEAELAGFAPVQPSARLVGGIEKRLEGRRRSDRWLRAAMTAGAIAACLDVALLTWPSAGANPPGNPAGVVAAGGGPTLADYRQSIARAAVALPTVVSHAPVEGLHP